MLDTTNDYMSDVDFFKIFGFRNVYSVDVSDYEYPTHVFDMNSEHIPASMTNMADCVVDGGTMEHVMSTLPFLRNAHLILKPGGIVIHMVPVNGYFNHGYFQFSPCFFHDYYKQNGYDIVMNYLVYQQQSDHWRKGPFRLVDLGQGYGQNDQLISDRIGTFFVARKCPGSTAGKVPELQTMYQQITSARMEANKNNEHRMKIRAQQIIERTG